MQDVLSCHCFLADAAFSEGYIFRNTTVEVMSNHDHIERLIGRIQGVRSRWSCRSWEDICFAAYFDKVRGVSPAGSFGVEGVDGSTLERRDSAFDETAFVQRVGMNRNLHIHLICDRETAIDGSRSCTPVFMNL